MSNALATLDDLATPDDLATLDDPDRDTSRRRPRYHQGKLRSGVRLRDPPLHFNQEVTRQSRTELVVNAVRQRRPGETVAEAVVRLNGRDPWASEPRKMIHRQCSNPPSPSKTALAHQRDPSIRARQSATLLKRRAAERNGTYVPETNEERRARRQRERERSARRAVPNAGA